MRFMDASPVTLIHAGTIQTAFFRSRVLVKLERCRTRSTCSTTASHAVALCNLRADRLSTIGRRWWLPCFRCDCNPGALSWRYFEKPFIRWAIFRSLRARLRRQGDLLQSAWESNSCDEAEASRGRLAAWRADAVLFSTEICGENSGSTHAPEWFFGWAFGPARRGKNAEEWRRKRMT